MSRSTEIARPAQTGQPGRVPLPDQTLFFLMLAVLCARPLIAETFEPLEFAFLAAVTAGAGPTPATTAVLDSLLLSAATIALVRRPWRFHRHRLLWVGAGLLLAALVVSVAVAGDKRTASLAGANLVLGVLVAFALLRVMRARWMAWVLLAGMLASGCATAAKCIAQQRHEFADTRDEWSHVRQRLEQQGYDLESPVIVNFERRMQANESFGYLSHPNLAATCLTTWLLIATGLLGVALTALVRRRDGPAAAWVLLSMAAVVLIGIGLCSTGSTGGQAAALGGLVAIPVLVWARRWIAARARLVSGVLLAAYVALVAGTAAYGLKHETLPHPSLAFRWHYWTAAGQAWREAPLTGVGRENFSAAFLRHKSAASVEEVRSPHNLGLTLLVELGPLGLGGGVLLVIGCLVGALRRLSGAETHDAQSQPPSAKHLLPFVVGVLCLQGVCSGTPLESGATAFVWSIDLAAVWTLAFFSANWLLGQVARTAAGVMWLGAGLVAALLATLAHNLIGFSLLTPAGLTVFVCTVAAALTMRPPWPASGEAATDDAGRPWAALATAALGLLLVAAHLGAVTVPTWSAEHAIHRMQAALHAAQPVSDEALRWGKCALRADPWSAATARAVSRATLEAAVATGGPDAARLDALLEAREHARTAATRDPRSVATYRLLAMLDERLEQTYLRMARPTDAVRAMRAAAGEWQNVVERYPTDPRARISAGQAWYHVWQETEADRAARIAVAHLEQALHIDDQRPSFEVMRLRPHERDVADELLSELAEAGFASEPLRVP